MQSKTKIFASFILVFSILFSLFLVFPFKDTIFASTPPISECVATSCGSSIGTKQEAVYKEVCDNGCPTIHFEWKRIIFEDCPSGYKVVGKDNDKCEKKSSHYKNEVIDRKKYEKTFSADVKYNKSNDPNKCHRPSDETLKNYYKMDHDARKTFKDENFEWKYSVEVNCRDIFVRYDWVACDNAPVIPCEQECPTQCGYQGGVVADGKGGEKECPATNSCSTHRWCFPDEESSTGYIARAISIDVIPKIGKPWEPGKMIDKYCAYTPAGTCPTQCDYKGGDEVADGLGGIKICQATQACKVDVGEVLGSSTVAEVKGTTTVVLAKTAAQDNSSIYLIQSLLMLVTGVSLIYVGKEYLNRY